jgi:hypothetical protein
MSRRILLLVLLLLSFGGLQAQELLLPLVVNPALKHATPPLVHKAKSGSGYTLPFVDDFSYDSLYPAPDRWENNYAYVNRSFGILPPSVGMATLDALNDTGAIYEHATSTPFGADSLTSLPIRMDSSFIGIPSPLGPSDSVFFSFYYQPQGNGNPPDVDDSLVLEFYTSSDNDWHLIWSIPGTSYQDFYDTYHRSFRQVVIPIIDPIYFVNDFQFRFRNYASIANTNLPSWQSNMDQWHIDYVYLDYNRGLYDTVVPDITFVNDAPSVLKNYMQMPARQYDSTELKDTLYMTISNLNNTINNISYRYVVNEVGGAYTHSLLGGDYDIQPFITYGYHDWPYHSKPVVDFNFPTLSGDSTVFSITHMLGINGWADNNIVNDTVRYYQRFYNYYAYDDGTAEAGYGLAGTGSRFAYQFTLKHSDTLGAVKMFFNQTFTPPTSRYFYIVVWESLSPEKILYKSSRVRPINEDSLNKYHTYFIDDTVLTLNGTFYVGWQQITDEVLNIGFDRNTDASDHMFFNTEGIWENSVYVGSVMLEPVLGTAGQAKKPEAPDGIQELQAQVYPNPYDPGNPFYIDLPDKYNQLNPEETVTLEIFDYMGQKVKELPWSSPVDLGKIKAGYYIIRINSFETGESCTRKLVVLGK